MDSGLEAQATAAGELAFLRYALDEHAIVATTDAAGTITSVNQKFCDISQYSREELVGQNHRIINSGQHPKSFFVEMWRTIAGGKTWRGEICNRAKDGSLYWVETTIVPIRRGDGPTDGPVEGYIAIRADITERKLMQELKIAEIEEINQVLQGKNAELEQYVYSVSHDLKSPIVTILGFMGMLKKQIEDRRIEGLNDPLDRVVRAANRMHGSINDLLELSRVSRPGGEVVDVDLGDVASAVAEELQPELAKRDAKLEIVGTLPVVQSERSRMWQIFQNLIGNAIKYGCTAAAPVIQVGGEQHDGETRIFVRDNGQGIPLQHHERIFELFQRLDKGKGSGTGVGLAIVRRIAEMHQGKAWVESEPGGGATFRVLLRRPRVNAGGRGEMKVGGEQP